MSVKHLRVILIDWMLYKYFYYHQHFVSDRFHELVFKKATWHCGKHSKRVCSTTEKVNKCDIVKWLHDNIEFEVAPNYCKVLTSVTN